MDSYAQAWSDLEMLRVAVEHKGSSFGPATVDHSIRLAQALLAEQLGYPDRVTAVRAHEVKDVK
jgi:hypothetical protein